jgi:hypothetical protein
MSSRTYICVPCRWSRRGLAAGGLNTDYRCPSCHKALWELEWRWRIPRKSNDKGWKELAAKVKQDSAILIPRRKRAGEIKVAKVNQLIAQVENQRSSKKSATKLKELKTKRARLVNAYGLKVR